MSAAIKLLCTFTILYSDCVFADRKVSTDIKHGCMTNTSVCGSLGHVMAVGGNDVLHYIVTTIGVPSVFVAYTSPAVKLSVDWDRLLTENTTEKANSVLLSPATDVHYTYTVLFTKLIDYNDTDDKADMSHYSALSTGWNIYDLNTFTWNNISAISDIKGDSLKMQASSNTPSELWTYNGTFSIQLSAYSNSGREPQLPHLQYSENITQFDLNIDHVWTNLSMSRFGVEIVMVAGGKDPMFVDETRSIDDEYTPGVFTIYNWLSKKSGDTGFLQWKPVCYKSLSRSRAEATGMKHYNLQKLNDDNIKLLYETLAYGYYGNRINNLMSQAANISFGLSKDGGYNKTQILTWSGSIGYGTPPKDAVSTLVIIVISAGLGLPAAIIIFGGIFTCIRKKNAKPDKPLQNIQGSGYQRISGDE